MAHERTHHYLILGAGAVGGTMGALLSRAGHAATLIGRPALAAAVAAQGGLRLVEAGRESLVPVEARASLAGLAWRGRPVLCLAMKAGDLGAALPVARAALPADTLTITWQNGIRAEDEARPFFPDLFGGIVRATSTMLEPGEVRIRTPGVLILGRDPAPLTGADPELDGLLADLRSAGYDAVASTDIRSDKALKLLVNLFSGASPLVRLDGQPAPELTRVECNVLIEGAQVLRAAGVPFEARAPRGDDVPTMLRHLRDRRPRPVSADRVHNSTWQNLHTPGRRLENDYMNGEIVTLARGLGLGAPWNQRLLELLNDVQAQGLGPGPFDDAAFGRRFADLPEPGPFEPATTGAR